MNKSTPSKHLTPNYKLVRHTCNSVGWVSLFRQTVWWVWEAQPLRANRKDLAT